MSSEQEEIPFYEALLVIDRMHKDGLFSSYAVGGAVAAYLFIEPAGTDDMVCRRREVPHGRIRHGDAA